ncbi:MAG: M12 family metallo-peptidase [Methanosarcinales archaeon]|nr:M12 family metallo-peptidase [Methanosarcinales archaeon]
MVDSGKQMDLNRDGIIEMGEENYYETSPNDVTYFLDIFAVADQDYVDYYDRFVEGNYKRIIQNSVNGADEYFMKQFDIKLKVVEIWHDWNSDDAKDTQRMIYLLDDAKKEYNWESNKRNTDALIAFTGKDPDYEGMADPNPSNLSVAVQIPELSDPRVLEFNEYFKYFGIYNAWVQYEWNQRLIQHEVSHLFGAYDYGLENPNYHQQDNITGIRLARIHSIMDKTRYSEDKEGFKADKTGNIWLCNEWNEESILIMNFNKASITNGSYKKSV